MSKSPLALCWALENATHFYIKFVSYIMFVKFYLILRYVRINKSESEKSELFNKYFKLGHIHSLPQIFVHG